MSDDYLWDRSGEPDPEVQRLEEILSRLRSDRPAPEIPRPLTPQQNRLSTRTWLRIAAAILLPAILIIGWLTLRRETGGWKVETLDGGPILGSRPLTGSGLLEVGEWLETDASSRAKIDVGVIGEVIINPNSRVRLLRAGVTDHRLRMVRGKMLAAIWAPPRFFSVETPSAVAIDLGCIYTMEVDDSGASLLHVFMGWVAFELDGRESFVPEGAICQTRPEIGPGTPYMEDASPEFRTALLTIDFERVEPDLRSSVLDTVLSQSRRSDALTLWHLLSRLEGDERDRVFLRLQSLVPPPAGVTLEGIRRMDKRMLDRWWNALGLQDVSWWRLWKGPSPLPK